MDPSVVKISRKASISLQTITRTLEPDHRVRAAVRTAGLASTAAAESVTVEEARVRVIVETRDPERTGNELVTIGASRVNRVAEAFISAEVPVASAAAVYESEEVKRMQTLKRKRLHMDRALPDGGVAGQAGRLVSQTGAGTLIAVVDSGFDLSHPMFRDAAGNLRVEALLDQSGATDREYTRAQLENAWSSGRKPGGDENGHGTHVASIAAGSPHEGLSGVAPESRLLLVKTDFLDLAGAVSWAFSRAASRPCAVNISLGHHYGPHDGTDQEERAIAQISGPGRVVVASAGNERNDNIHIGMRFSQGQTETAVFDIAGRNSERPFAVITLWHNASDRFDFSLVSPSGSIMLLPPIDSSVSALANGFQIELSRQRYSHNGLIQGQIQLSAPTVFMPPNALRGWKIIAVCRRAVTGRLDGWFHNGGYGEFRMAAIVESARTIGMPATGKDILAVASHVSKNAWPSDQGDRRDLGSAVGRNSSFSSRGPTRDGDNKPEISAPGQYLTAALADGSELSQWVERTRTDRRLISIEGTSMASPFVTGVVALMLEAQPGLTSAQIRDEFRRTGRKDAHTSPLEWTPDYGYGKISAIDLLRGAAEPIPMAAAASRRGAEKATRRARRPSARKVKRVS